MERFEMIEKLRERADISYEEARDVMEQANGDLLEALVLLEKQGKLSRPKAAAAHAAGETGAEEEKQQKTRGVFHRPTSMPEPFEGNGH